MTAADERSLANDPLSEVALAPDYVVLRCRQLQRAASFAPFGGGIRDARLVAIHEVKNADLPLGRDPLELLDTRMRKLGAADAPPVEHGVGMLTSRRVSAVELADCVFGELHARVVATAGLSNCVSVGDTPGELEAWGTINVIAQLNLPLTDNALLEALTIVAEARTRAVLDAGVRSRRSVQLATGTGTDCIAVLSPRAESNAACEAYAGKHTGVGHVLGAATLRALTQAITCWKTEYGV